jgi:hypothetical protein
MPRFLFWFLASVALVSSAAAQSPQLGGALPQPLPLFPLTNWWNTDVSAAPVDPKSAAYIEERGVHQRYRGEQRDASRFRP